MTKNAIDTETLRITAQDLAPPLVCLTTENEIFVHEGPEGYGLYRTRLEVDRVLSEGCFGINIAFDMMVLARQFGVMDAVLDAYDQDRITDVALREKLIDIATQGYTTSYGMDDMIKRRFGVKIDKSVGALFERVAGVPVEDWPSQYVTYCADDIADTRALKDAQDIELAQDGAEHVLSTEFEQARAAFALHLISVHGFKIDGAHVKRSIEELDGHLAETRDLLVPLGLVNIAGKRNMKAIREEVEHAFQVMGKPTPVTDGGKAKTDADTLGKAATVSPRLAVLALYQDLQSQRSFFAGLPADAARPRWNSLLETGRISSSKPQTMNIRRALGARESFVAREGCALIVTDYAMIEVCTLAQKIVEVFGSSKLADSINAGIDIHSELGANIAGMPYVDFKAMVDAQDPASLETRQLAKIGIFGFGGGMSPRSMVEHARTSADVEMTLEQAEMLFERYSTTYPDITESYFGWIRSLVGYQGDALIRHEPGGHYRAHVGFTRAANSFFQERAARICKRALWALTMTCYHSRHRADPLYGSRPVNVVHDEIITETRAENVRAKVERQETIMLEQARTLCPDVKIRVETKVMRRWTKNKHEHLEY